jgi:TRAP-type C4-dicarboxylate transport system permease small subunit
MWSLLKHILTKSLEWLVIVAVAALVLDVLWGVTSRFVLRSPSGWTEEAAEYLLIWVSLLGAAVAFGRNAHLGVDYLLQKLEPAAQRCLRVATQLVVILFAGATMIGGGYILVAETLRAGQVSPALSLPVGAIYLAVPLSGVCIVFYALDRILQQCTGAEPSPPQPDQKGP